MSVIFVRQSMNYLNTQEIKIVISNENNETLQSESCIICIDNSGQLFSIQRYIDMLSQRFFNEEIGRDIQYILLPTQNDFVQQSDSLNRLNALETTLNSTEELLESTRNNVDNNQNFWYERYLTLRNNIIIASNRIITSIGVILIYYLIKCLLLFLFPSDTTEAENENYLELLQE